tara:strand:- start:681 stop:833 length:153 start_codon:yes stop_codon:yes gene_type:complete
MGHGMRHVFSGNEWVQFGVILSLYLMDPTPAALLKRNINDKKIYESVQWL